MCKEYKGVKKRQLNYTQFFKLEKCAFTLLQKMMRLGIWGGGEGLLDHTE